MQGSKSCVGLVVLETRGPLTVYRELRVARYRNSFQSAREVQPDFNPTKEVDMADNQGGGSNRGTAAMDEEQRREIASKGGQNVPAEERSFSKDHELAKEAGKKGGESVPDEKRSFSQDRELAREAGKKGGENSGGNR